MRGKLLRKLMLCTLILLFMFSSLVSAQIPDMTLLDKAGVCEKVLYGAEQTGALIDRVAKLEKDLYGLEAKGALMTRLDKIYSYVKEPSTQSANFIAKMNGVEWMVNHAISNLPAKDRIEALERTLLGNVVQGALDTRLNKLVQLSFQGGYVTLQNTQIPKDTLIKIKLVTPLDSSKNRVGDVVKYQVAEDVVQNGVMMIASGAQGQGKISSLSPSKNFGRDAKLVVDFDTVEAVDGSSMETILGDKAKAETKSLALAAGASVVGVALLGPIGVIGGVFVHGNDIVIPEGSVMYIQTQADKEAYGIKLN